MQRYPDTPVLLALSLLFAAAGCPREDSDSRAPEPVSGTPTESAWELQVADVRNARSTAIRITARSISPAQWAELRQGCELLETLDIESLDAPEDSLSLLANLPQLRHLRIGSPVSDTGLQQIAQIRSLRVLNLPAGRFTDAGLAALTGLPDLELLRFCSPLVTNEGMQHIARMPSLRFLHLIDVPITDGGLPSLYGLKELESFYLDGGRCTDEGLSRLLEALPDLHFHRDQLHLPGDPHTHPH